MDDSFEQPHPKRAKESSVPRAKPRVFIRILWSDRLGNLTDTDFIKRYKGLGIFVSTSP